ncbi:winged helix-turn-helix domain-containing protein [Chordicoccus furentiruminis]|uniref:winged helix-turn-helix domain-containing protein n=1 Tax=Chordicoccus furentiruminis TaxID=2709410 RepID=UPI0023A8D603|nr:winged helix-turn-helix domain-containing protein [Chordicoccus furentiruminis]
MDILPSKSELAKVILQVMEKSPDPISVTVMNEKVAKELNLSDDLLQIEEMNGTDTEFNYRMRWARTELKNKGRITNPSRGVWELTS